MLRAIGWQVRRRRTTATTTDSEEGNELTSSSTIYRWLLGAALLAGSAMPALADDFSLDALIAAAKQEGPITVYATTGKIVETAQNFTKKYGIEATGKKVNEPTQVELFIREAQAGKIVGDISVSGDVAASVAQLIPEGIAYSWVPPDLAADIPAALQNPLVVVSDEHVISYNTEAYDKCPITNLWQLTEPEWKGKVAMLDPLDKPNYADWFNQMATHHDAELAKAYQDLYGKPLDAEPGTATKAWVKALAANAPLLADSEAVSAAVGAPGQKAPFVGLNSVAKFRNNVDKGYKLGICAGIDPVSGFIYPGFGLIAKGSKSPNAAKLFIHYLMTEEGISNQTVDGKVSGNSKVPPNADEQSGIAAYMNQLTPYDSSTAADDYDARQDWQDFWTINYKR
jgi:iron(III) transport system substrate-binding protein